MDMRNKRAARRIVVALLLATGLGGCVYAPPYAAYDSYYPAYSYPVYVGPPVALGFGYYHHHHHHYHRHGYHGGHSRHGWGGWRH